MSDHDLTAIQGEQRAFERRLKNLLDGHRDEFVVFHGGKPAAFFPGAGAAYSWALERFGPDEIFLVAQVTEPTEGSVSVSWDAGVLFG